MTPIVVPIGETLNIGTGTGTGADTALQFRFNKVQSILAGMHLHVIGLEFPMLLNVAGAGTSDAIAVEDWPLFISSLSVNRSPTKPVISALNGWALYVLAAMNHLGRRSWRLPALIAANSGATTARAFRPVVWFDRPFAAKRRYEYLYPVGAFKDEGEIRININAPSGYTGITIASGTVSCNLLCVGLDEPRLPPDLRYSPLSMSDTGNKTVQFTKGTYQSIIYAPWKIAGQSLAGITFDGASSNQSALFKSAPAVSTLTAAAASYCERWSFANSLDVYDSQSDNLVTQGKVCPLWAPGAFTEATKGAFTADDDFTVDLGGSPTVTNGHYFILGRILPQDQESANAIAAAHKIGPYVIATDVAEPRVAGQELLARRAPLLGKKLISTNGRK